MFEPGHLHLVSLPGLDQQDINIHIRYEVRQNAESGAYVHFDMDGEIDGKPFSDSFELPRDTAFNFASDATRVAQKHGLHPKFGAITRVHKEYDAMFEDIRAKLHAHPGEPVDLERIILHELAVSLAAGSMGKVRYRRYRAFFSLQEKPLQGLATLAGKRKRLAACRFRVAIK